MLSQQDEVQATNVLQAVYSLPESCVSPGSVVMEWMLNLPQISKNRYYCKALLKLLRACSQDSFLEFPGHRFWKEIVLHCRLLLEVMSCVSANWSVRAVKWSMQFQACKCPNTQVNKSGGRIDQMQHHFWTIERDVSSQQNDSEHSLTPKVGRVECIIFHRYSVYLKGTY